MAKLEALLKQVVARVARREIRGAVSPLSRELRRLRSTTALMRKSLKSLEGEVKRARKGVEAGGVPQASEEDAKSARIGSRWVKTLRRRINVSQSELAFLLGISTSAVRTWEYGISRPRGENRKTLVALRGMGRREVKKLLLTKATVVDAGGGAAGNEAARGATRRRRARPRKPARAAASRRAPKPRRRAK